MWYLSISILALTVVLAVTAMILNCIVIHVLRKQQQRKAFETVLLSLTVSETLTNVLSLTISILLAVRGNISNSVLVAAASNKLWKCLLTYHHLILI